MPGLLRMAGRTAMVAGTATAVSGRVARRQANRYAQQDQAAAPSPAYAAPAQQPASAPSASDDMYIQLEKLGQLKEQGILTDQEFAAQKAKILAG